MNKLDELHQRYYAAMHGVQAGVSLDIEDDPSSAEPKHLRVGFNSAFVNEAAIVRLLIDKGLCTEVEYWEHLVAEAEAERTRYETKISKRFGAKVTLR